MESDHQVRFHFTICFRFVASHMAMVSYLNFGFQKDIARTVFAISIFGLLLWCHWDHRLIFLQNSIYSDSLLIKVRENGVYDIIVTTVNEWFFVIMVGKCGYR